MRPLSQQEVEFCRHQVIAGTASGPQSAVLRAHPEGSNFVLSDSHCKDGTVPFPRPQANIASDGWHSLTLSSSCPVDQAFLRGFSQSEFEEPQCPDGFCPSPTLCQPDTWELKPGLVCLLEPALEDEADDVTAAPSAALAPE